MFCSAKFSYFGVHGPKFNDRDVDVTPGMVTWTNAAGQPMGDKYLIEGWRSNSDNVTNEFAQVNCYAIRSREKFLLKRLRGTANSKTKIGSIWSIGANMTSIRFEATTIRTEGLNDQINKWLADPDRAALARACTNCSQRVLDYQLTVPEFRTFIDTGF